MHFQTSNGLAPSNILAQLPLNLTNLTFSMSGDSSLPGLSAAPAADYIPGADSCSAAPGCSCHSRPSTASGRPGGHLVVLTHKQQLLELWSSQASRILHTAAIPCYVLAHAFIHHHVLETASCSALHARSFDRDSCCARLCRHVLTNCYHKSSASGSIKCQPACSQA